MTHYPSLPNQNHWTKLLGEGAFGAVYDISRKDNLVAKTLTYCPRAYGTKDEALRWECAVARLLYRSGVSVPRPEGLYTVRIRQRESIFSRNCSEREESGFVMERIRGQRLDELFSQCPKDIYVHSLWEEELQKARDLGFELPDATTRNAFYLPAEQRVVLFDFGFWVHPEPERVLEEML
ncbi:hypothetical protein HY496_00100 [Candidatus Woesearchaeota archaeon]|nr:hypothetical protein [Candidatus Woesearchaeota archaeon]